MVKKGTKYQRVKSMVCYVMGEDGKGARKPVTLWLDASGETALLMHVPDYIQSALGVDAEVRGHSAETVRDDFELLSRKYAEWYNRREAKPVIILHVKYYGQKDELHIERDSFFISSGSSSREGDRLVAVGVTYTLAFEVDGHVHYRELRRVYTDRPGEEEREPPGCHDSFSQIGEYPEHGFKVIEKVGFRVAHVEGVVLPYTPELHAKIDVICNAINDAACMLHSILEPVRRGKLDYHSSEIDTAKAEQVTARLMSLGVPQLTAPQEKPKLKKRGT